jgi:serine/threonine protein kinase
MPQATDFIGMTFGAYRLVSPLGRGGMGAVYRGYQESIDRSVAIKILPAELLDDPQFLEHFAGEARALARLTHNGILPMYEYGEAHGAPYIVMPVMSGGSLAERIKAGPLSLSETVRVLAPIAESLDFAHQHNVLHRDVKPSNILFDDNDNAVLADFGLAKLLESDSRSSVGQISGTPAYMSPEQALGQVLDGRSDLYSLAVVAYEALTGRLPFESRNAIQLAMKHVNEAPPRLRDVKAEISAAVDEIVLKALHKAPAGRYATPGEFLQALSNAAYLSRDFWRPASRRAAPAEEAPPPPAAGGPGPEAAETPPMDRPTLSPDQYTQVKIVPGLDPYDIPDPTRPDEMNDGGAPEGGDSPTLPPGP